MACGVERWSIKTLKDRPRLLRARKTTAAHLVGLPRPTPFPPPGRAPLERRIYSVVAAVTLDRSEADLDHHLVLRSGSRTMIAETPSSLCTAGATLYRRKQMADARKVGRVCTKARVVGVAFLDYNPRPDGSSSERDRAPPGSRLRLPVTVGNTASREKRFLATFLDLCSGRE
jgi:hypothetical protein